MSQSKKLMKIQYLNNLKNKELRALVLDRLRRLQLFSVMILCLFAGPASFLFSYPKYSIIGFSILTVLCFFAFIIFRIIPDKISFKKRVILTDSERQEIEKLYKEQKNYNKRLIRIIKPLAVFFGICSPICAGIIYFSSKNIIMMDYILGTSLIILGIIIYLWYTNEEKTAILREIITQQ